MSFYCNPKCFTEAEKKAIKEGKYEHPIFTEYCLSLGMTEAEAILCANAVFSDTSHRKLTEDENKVLKKLVELDPI